MIDWLFLPCLLFDPPRHLFPYSDMPAPEIRPSSWPSARYRCFYCVVLCCILRRNATQAPRPICTNLKGSFTARELNQIWAQKSGVTIILAPRQTFATGWQSWYIIRVTLGPFTVLGPCPPLPGLPMASYATGWKDWTQVFQWDCSRTPVHFSAVDVIWTRLGGGVRSSCIVNGSQGDLSSQLSCRQTQWYDGDPLHSSLPSLTTTIQPTPADRRGKRPLFSFLLTCITWHNIFVY